MKHLKKWTRPSNYVGANWPEWYSVYSQHRDSDYLTRANFDEILHRLGGESETVQVIRESHWAVGWVEWIGIHESNAVVLQAADAMLEKIKNYPILNEERFSEYEQAEALLTWQNCYSLKERVALCRECGESIFAARHTDYFPDSTGRMTERLTSC